MESTGPDVPPVLPGQGPYMRDVLHRCIIEASGEIDGVGEISERALNSIADIVLDCEGVAGACSSAQRRCGGRDPVPGEGERGEFQWPLAGATRGCQLGRWRHPADATSRAVRVARTCASQTFSPWARLPAAWPSCSAGRASTLATCSSECGATTWRPQPSRAQRQWRPSARLRLPKRTWSAAASTKSVRAGRRPGAAHARIRRPRFGRLPHARPTRIRPALPSLLPRCRHFPGGCQVVCQGRGEHGDKHEAHFGACAPARGRKRAGHAAILGATTAPEQAACCAWAGRRRWPDGQGGRGGGRGAARGRDELAGVARAAHCQRHARGDAPKRRHILYEAAGRSAAGGRAEKFGACGVNAVASRPVRAAHHPLGKHGCRGRVCEPRLGPTARNRRCPARKEGTAGRLW